MKKNFVKSTKKAGFKPNEAPKARPLRGEVWWFDLDPVNLSDVTKKRPCVILSVDQINNSTANIAIVAPIEFENLGIVSHIHVDRRDVDIQKSGYIHCEDLRKISLDRAINSAGRLPSSTMNMVEETISLLLGLD